MDNLQNFYRTKELALEDTKRHMIGWKILSGDGSDIELLPGLGPWKLLLEAPITVVLEIVTWLPTSLLKWSLCDIYSFKLLVFKASDFEGKV